MSFRFTRRIHIFPGISINLSKSGASLSLGPRGAKVTIGMDGIRGTLGVPGTGIYYTKKVNWNKKDKKKDKKAIDEPKELKLEGLRDDLDDKDERKFVDGIIAFLEGKEKDAVQQFEKVDDLPDAAFMSGFTYLKQEKFDESKTAFLKAEKDHKKIGSFFEKYEIALDLLMPITDELIAHITPGRPGLLLGLVEAYQALKDYKNAIETVKTLKSIAPDDIVVKVSYAELVLESESKDDKSLNEIIQISENIENETAVHGTLLLYRAKALRKLKRYEEAKDLLTATMRKKKDREEELLHSLRYERALTYENMGEKSKAKADYKRIYEENPDFADVASVIE